jgi:hypothetical protein
VFTSLPYNTDITENNIYLDCNIIINKVKEVSINGDDQSNINIVSGIINLLGDSGQRSLELNIGDIDTNNDVSVTLNGNITIPNNNNSTTTFIGATTIEASKVFGAVWA